MALIRITIQQNRNYSIGASFPLLEPEWMGGGQRVFGAGISTAQKALFPVSFFSGTSIPATLIDGTDTLDVTLGFAYPAFDGTYPEPWAGINGFLNLQDPSGYWVLIFNDGMDSPEFNYQAGCIIEFDGVSVFWRDRIKTEELE